MAAKISVWRAKSEDTLENMQGEYSVKEWSADEKYSRIGDKVFKGNSKLKRVVLNAHIKEVGIQSFSNSTLRAVHMAGIRTIRKEAFSNCVRLSEVQIPETTGFIGVRAFAQCRRLERAEFASGSICREIKAETFANCASLKSIQLPEQLRKIGEQAFFKCVMLDRIEFPASLKEIGTRAFYQTALSQLELPSGLEKIGDSAFLKCNRLEIVKLPESVETIEKWAFHGCNRLKILEIAHEPKEIGEWVINRSARIRCYRGGIVDKYCRDMGFQAEYL
ncbi:MAG: leucine-rich repeat domain-containing protein [Lachnospiraceae bacterium]